MKKNPEIIICSILTAIVIITLPSISAEEGSIILENNEPNFSGETYDRDINIGIDIEEFQEKPVADANLPRYIVFFRIIRTVLKLIILGVLNIIFYLLTKLLLSGSCES